MSRLSQGVKVSIMVVLLAGGGYGVWKALGTRSSGADNRILAARFRDASGLPVGSRVVVAGLPVGEISNLRIEGRHARVSFRLRDDLGIWSNAIVFKKSSSLLGDYYLEIDPGAPESLDARGNRVQNQELDNGDVIPRVIEATSPDELIRRIEESMPNVDKVLLAVRDLADDLRQVVNGPLAQVVKRIDSLVATQAETVTRILEQTDASVANIERITDDIRGITAGRDKQFDDILESLAEASAEARNLVMNAQEEVKQTGDQVRQKIDLVDEILVSSSSVVKKIDEDQGTLGRLVNDSTIVDNVEEITEDAKGFLDGLLGIQTYVGLRTEYNILAASSRNYLTVELATRPDKYYYIELITGPRGATPKITLETDPVTGATEYRRRVVIEDDFRFTLQFAKRIGWATFRMGLKESRGGVGFDVNTTWLGRHLALQSDLFEFGFNEMPRLRLTAAVELFRYLYVIGGVEDVLNSPGRLPIIPGPEVPKDFEEYRYGRDVFAGAMLRFNDKDLAALLTVGGSALTAVIE